MSDARAALPLSATAGVWSPVFTRIWTAIFVSSVSGYFLLMTLAARIFAETGSAFLANGIVLTQWLPAVIALSLIRWAVGRHLPRSLLVSCELGSVLAIAVVSVTYTSIFVLAMVLLVKGGLDALSKVARTGALKGYFTGKALDSAASYYNTAALAGQGAGALLGAALLGRMGLSGVLVICAVLHLCASALYWSLPRVEPAQAGGAQQQVHGAAVDEKLRAAVIYFVAAVCLYQGFHNIARSAFPVRQLGLGESAIPLLQTITNVAYIVGAFVAARFSIGASRYPLLGGLFHLAPLLVLIPLAFVQAQLPGLVLYALFGFAFEVAYCVHLRYIITAAPAATMARLVADTNAMAMGAMVAVSLLGSYLADRAGLTAVNLALVLFAVLVPLVVYLGQRRRSHAAVTPQARER